MARPYILIQKEILYEIEDLYFKGVATRKLVRQYNLTIASPTLQRLLTYLTLAERSMSKGDLALSTRETIHSSLFPPWLEEKDSDEVSQPHDWFYEGNMPLGKWVKRKGKK